MAAKFFTGRNLNDNIYENDIEEIIVDGDSDEDFELEANTSSDPVQRFLHNQKEHERRRIVSSLYSNIQKVLGAEVEAEPRVKTLSRATEECKSLCREELNLKLEAEILLQKNWKLKRQVEKLQKKKRRKSGSATVSRRLSVPPLVPLKITPVEKRSASFDGDAQFPLQPVKRMEVPINDQDKEPTLKIIPSNRSNRKKKKRSGLSEEEKEFYKIEEKIEDILYEVEALWNDVKNYEENESDEPEDKKGILNNVVKHIDGTPVYEVKSIGCATKSNSGTNKEIIKLTDINKLLDSEAIKLKANMNATDTKRSSDSHPIKNIDIIRISNLNQTSSTFQNIIAKSKPLEEPKFVTIYSGRRKSSSSGDESPRLVIDESPKNQEAIDRVKPSQIQRDIDVMEALQAVETLCMSLVADEPTTSESTGVNVAERMKNDPVEKSDVIAISDSDEDTAHSDVVCID